MEMKIDVKIDDGTVEMEGDYAAGHAMVIQQRSVDEANLMSDHMTKSLQRERQLLQEKMYTSWLNYRLLQVAGSPQIVSLFEDLRDGKYLLALLELLTGKKLNVAKGEMRVHHLSNLAKVLKTLQECGIKLVGIHNENICNGDVTSILAVCWSLIYHFQVLQGVKGQNQENTEGGAEQAVLAWCRDIAKSYTGADVKSFQPSRWKTGYMLNAIIHSFNPKLFNYSALTKFDDTGRIQHALDLAYTNYEVPKLFTAYDFENDVMDNKTLVLYVSLLKENITMDREKEKKQKEEKAHEFIKKVRTALEEYREIIHRKETNELITLPTDVTGLPFSELKKLATQYWAFQKELSEVCAKLMHLKDEVDANRGILKNNSLAKECIEVHTKAVKLKESGKGHHEVLQKRKMGNVKVQLVIVTENVAALQNEADIVFQQFAPTATKEELEHWAALCKDLLERLQGLQASVKEACGLVDQAYADKTLAKTRRQEFKNSAIGVLEEYAKLMQALETHQKTCKDCVDDGEKSLQSKIEAWRDNVKEVDVWLDENLHKYEHLEMKYGSLEDLKEVNREVQDFLKGISERWKKFEKIAGEWNNELCDQLNDDHYADILADTQGKFNRLNDIAVAQNNMISSMVKQKESEEHLLVDLQNWRTYLHTKEAEVSVEVDGKDVVRFLMQLEEISKEIDLKDVEVKSFVSATSIILQSNKYDADVVLHIEAEVKDFCDKWDQLIYLTKGTKLRLDHLTQRHKVQTESERNLIESLADWNKILARFRSTFDDIGASECSSIQHLQNAITQLSGLLSEVSAEDDNIKAYDHNSHTLIDTLDPDVGAQLNVNFQLFFKQWNDLQMGISEEILSLQEQLEEHINNEHNIVGKLEAKSMVIEEEYLAIESGLEQFSAPPDDIDDYDSFFADFEELCTKVDAHEDLAENEADDLHLPENKDKVQSVLTSVNEKKLALQAKKDDAKKTMEQMVERRRLQKENEESLQASLAGWKAILDDNTMTLDNCNVSERSDILDTEMAVDILEALLSEINRNDEELKEYDVTTQQLISTLEADLAAQHTLDIKLFFNTWHHIKDKASERLNGLKMQLGQLGKNEQHIMDEWIGTASKTAAWLEESEKDTAAYCSPPDTVVDIQTFLSDFEELRTKVTTKEEAVNEQVEHGNALVDSKKVQKEENVKQIENDVSLFTASIATLHQNLANASKLSGHLKQRQTIQKQTERNLLDSLADWQRLLDSYMLRLEKCVVNKDSDLEAVEQGVHTLEILLEDIDSDDVKLQEYDSNSRILIDLLHQEKTDQLGTQFNNFFENWDECKDKVQIRLLGLRLQLEQDLKTIQETMAEWDGNAQKVHTWLDKVINTTLSYCRPLEQSADLHELLAQFEHFSTQVQAEEEFVNEQTRNGTSLVAGNKLKLKENKAKVHNDLTIFTQKKNTLQRNLANAQKYLADVKQQNTKQDEWENKLNLFKKYLQEKQEEHNGLHHEILSLRLAKVTLLFDQLNGKSVEVESLKNFSVESLGSNKHNIEAAEKLLASIHVFLKEWDHFKEVLQSSISDMGQQSAKENELKDKLFVLKKFLEEKKDEFNTLPHLPPQDTLPGVMLLQEELNARREEFESLEEFSVEVCRSTHDKEAMEMYVNTYVKTFFKEWNSFQDVMFSSIAELEKIIAMENELKHKLLELKEYLEEKKEEFNVFSASCDTKSQLCLPKISIILDHLRRKSSDVEYLQSFAIEVVSSNKHKDAASRLLSDVNAFSKEWNTFSELLKTTMSRLAGMKDHNIKLDEIKHKLSQFKTYLNEKREELDDISEETLHVALPKVTELLDWLNAKYMDVISLQTFCVEASNSNIHNKEATEKLLFDVNIFVEEWDVLKHSFQEKVHSLAGLKEETLREEELKHKLYELRKYLNEKREDFNGLVDDIPQVALPKAMLLLDQIKWKSLKVDSIENVSNEIVLSSKYNKEALEKLMSDVNTFALEWNAFKCLLETSTSSLSSMIEEQNTKEDQLKHKLYDLKKFLDDERQDFTGLTDEIPQEAVPKIMLLLKKFDSRDDDLRALQDSTVIVVSSYKHDREAAEKIQSKVNAFSKEWNLFKDTLQSSLAGMQDQDVKEDELQHLLFELKKFLEDKKEEYNGLRDDLPIMILPQLTQVLDELRGKSFDVESLENFSIEVVSSSHNKQSAAKLLSDVNSLSKQWLAFIDQLQTQLSSLSEIQEQDAKEEELKGLLLDLRKFYAERRENFYMLPSDDPLHVRMNKVKYIMDQMKWKSKNHMELLQNFTIEVVSNNKHNKEASAKLLSDVNTFSKEWSMLIEEMQSKHLSLSEIAQHGALEERVKEQFAQLKKFLEEKTHESNSLVDDNLQHSLEKVKAIVEELNTIDTDVESLQEFSMEVVSSNRHDRQSATRLLSDVNMFVKQWNDFNNTMKKRKLSLTEMSEQKRKQEELKQKLSSLKYFLNGKKDEVDTLDDHLPQMALDKCTMLLDELNMKHADMELLQNFSIEVISTTKHNKEVTSKLLSDVNTFSHEWNAFREKLQSKISRLEAEVTEDASIQDQLMVEWDRLSEEVVGWLDEAEDKLAQYTIYHSGEDYTDSSEAYLTMYHTDADDYHISEAIEEEMVEKLCIEEKLIGEKLEYGKKQIDQVKSEEKKEWIQKCIVTYTQRKLILDTKLQQAKQLLDDMSIQHMKDGEIKKNIKVWKKYLYEKKEELNKVIKLADLRAALEQAELIVTELTMTDNEVELFVKTSEERLTSNKYYKGRSQEIQADLTRFFVEWNGFNENAQNTTDSIQSKILMRERLAMEELQLRSGEVEEWLVEAEQEFAQYAEPPDDFDVLNEYSSKFENLVSKLATQEVAVEEKLQYSSGLAESDQLTQDKNRESVRNVVAHLSSRKQALNKNLLNAQKWLSSAREKLDSAETEELMNWFSDANAIKEMLRAYETVGREDVIRTVKEGEQALQRQQSLVDELDDHQPAIDNLLRCGGGLLTNKNWGQAKHNELVHEMKIIEQRWKALRDRIGDVLERYKGILTQVREAGNEKVQSLLMRVDSFNNWLLFAKKQLHVGRKPNVFSEYIQRESGLKKLSTDLESRSPEFDYLVKILQDLTPEKVGKLSAQDEQLLLATQNLNKEWDMLIDNIDVEFKDLYEAINCLLDTRRGEIEKSLKLVKNNLSQIKECSNTQKEMLFSSQKLAELNGELSKLKSNVTRLVQQTSSLNDVTVFMDNEKELQMLVKSGDDLLAEYGECVQQSTDATKWFQQCMIDYFNRQCGSAKNLVEVYQSEIPVYNTDEEDLNVLREYLIQEQQIMDDVKAEHLLIDNLEHFAEEISSHGVLTNNDQVLIAETINEVLKAFDHLRSLCKEGTNRVYAVTMHIFNHHLHNINEEQNSIQKDVDRAMNEWSDIAEFDQALHAYTFAQSCEDKMEDTASQIALLTQEINKWVELKIIELPDVKKLREKDTLAVKESNNLSANIEELKIRIEDQIREIVRKKLEDFAGWLPIVQKRIDEGDAIGPNNETVTKQMQEMKVIEGQALQMSFSFLLDEKCANVYGVLDEEEQGDIQEAHSEWCALKNWVDKRLETLQKSGDLWDDFKSRKVDLADYLRDIDKELQAASAIDLSDADNVETRMDEFTKVTSGMEHRKYHVANFVEIADQLISLIKLDTKADTESTLPNSILSQVADILDLWNSSVKRSIEFRTKLVGACGKFEVLKKTSNAVREWIGNLNSLLDKFTADVSGEHINELLVQLEEKYKEQEDMKATLAEINAIDKELTDNGEVSSQYSLEGSIAELNQDFNGAINQLEELHRLKGKVRILSRRVRGSTRNTFTGIHDRTRSLISTKRTDETMIEST